MIQPSTYPWRLVRCGDCGAGVRTKSGQKAYCNDLCKGRAKVKRTRARDLERERYYA